MGNKRWRKLAKKFNNLRRRERILVLACSLAVIWAVMNSLLLEPSLQWQQNLQEKLESGQKKVTVLETQIDVTKRQPVIDPDVENRKQLEVLLSEQQAVSEQLSTMQQDLVSPDQMVSLLTELVNANQSLTLISLKTVPTSEVEVSSSTPEQPRAPSSASNNDPQQLPAEKIVIYQHGVQLTLQGRYLDMITYLKKVEALPWNMLWGRSELNATRYPLSTLTITIYTLSLDNAWMTL